eukprot:scaffold291440_cov15-Tisochrysis_lutea.AAC.1
MNVERVVISVNASPCLECVGKGNGATAILTTCTGEGCIGGLRMVEQPPCTAVLKQVYHTSFAAKVQSAAGHG